MLKWLPSLVLVMSLFANHSASAQVNTATPPGFVPQVDGRELNLGFETGDLTDWKATGKAWEKQPHKGNIDQNRPYGKGRKSLHTGDYWLGGYEFLRDTPIGTLTSVPFEVTARWCSFLMGGGQHPQTRVEIVEADSGKVFFKISGRNREEMQPVVVDLNRILNTKIFIRIVDEHTGGWGHVNFDDFRLYKQRPKFKEQVLSPQPVIEQAELYPYENLSGEEAARVMQVPPGFDVQLAAAEPDIMQPIAMAIDDRGRVWVAEAYEYPTRAEPGKGRDRILIFEDTDLDGTLDKRTVFIEGLNLVSGLEVGFGGVWVGAAPYLMFIPDRDYDDVPDTLDPLLQQAGEVPFPQDVPKGATVLLDGFGHHDTHETLNAFIWGPDGWLYGCHGVFTHSRVGKPGTPDEERTPINAGIWRYHPVKHEFEVFAEGTSNPWGIDFNEYGEAFATACVIPHLYHIIPGARYQRQAGQHFNPHTYDDIKTIARHRHFVGNQWNNTDRKRSDDLGGGHAHAGAMIYLGGAWPKEYHGKLFMNNIHGNRINIDQLIPEGSGYAGDRYPDFLLTGDKWSQMIYMTYGPDGQMYVIDWYDQNQCHRREDQVHDRSNGRIFRVSYGGAKPVKVDLQAETDEELVRLAMESENEWFIRHARRILQERRALGQIDQERAKELMNKSDGFGKNLELNMAILRLLWLQHVLLGPDVIQDEIKTMDFQDVFEVSAETRSWFIRCFTESKGLIPENYERRIQLAKEDPSPVVRLAIASALQSMPLERRWEILAGLTSHPEDASDHNLPLMYWYAMEPLADANPQRALALAMSAGKNIPMLREFMIRKLGSGELNETLKLLLDGLASAEDDAVRMTFLEGIWGALYGRKIPAEFANQADLFKTLSTEKQAADSPELYVLATKLRAAFGDASAVADLQAFATSEHLAEARAQAMQALQQVSSDGLAPVVQKLLSDNSMRSHALKMAAATADPKIYDAIVAAYASFNPAEKQDARNTLASRPFSAVALLTAVEENRIPKQDLSADLVRQMRNLENDEVKSLLQKVWGVVRETDRKQLIADYTALISDPTKPAADPNLGRAIYNKTCQQCHTLFDQGGQVGPNITGANRKDLNYLLTNILDPSAVMAKEYQPVVLALADGRVITGIVKEENERTLKVQTTNEILNIATNDIDARKQSDKSMMPDDLLRNLSEHEARSIVAYLQQPNQVAMAATAENTTQFFNGKDLAGWRASRQEDAAIWSVENGEIVGKTDGLKHNSFLVSDLSVSDFRLTVDVHLVNNQGNSGIQFRSVPLSDGEMKGYQADIGAGWWGKLYEERGRALLAKEEHQPREGWNTYEIVAVGDRVQAFLNGKQAFDLVDPAGNDRGQIALQVHSGGAMEVRFRNLKLELLSPIPKHAAQGTQPGTWPSNPALAEGQTVTWKKTVLDDLFRSEGCCVADFNNDGLMDVAAGPMWYEQSITTSEDGTKREWTQHLINGDQPPEHDPARYSNSFMNFADDINHDGWVDLIVIDFPGNQTWWFENPGAELVNNESSNPWKRHEITPVTNNESPQYLDITGDGQRELLCGFENGVMGFASPQSLHEAPWKVHAVSGSGAPGTNRFSHGIGSGDIDMDGDNDILCTNGWWENPGTSFKEGDAISDVWTFNDAPFGAACSHMYVYDFDGDGDNDVLSCSAHQYGMWWHENLGSDDKDSSVPTKWETHLIDESFSQTHSVVLADMNGDGKPDFVTGKRHWAHGGHDPGGNDPAVVAWYELQQTEDGPNWNKHQVDDNSGVGTQFEVADINGDGLLDIITSNKKGTFVLEQSRE